MSENTRYQVRNLSWAARSRSGFSLVELIVAAGILGFTIAALLAFFINAVTLNEISRDRTTAVSHAQYVLEDIRNASFSDIADRLNEGTWNWNTATIAARGLVALKDESIVTTYSGTNLLNVTVTITWSETAGRAQSLVLTTQMGGG